MEITVTNAQYHLDLPPGMPSCDVNPQRSSVWSLAAAKLRGDRAARRAVPSANDVVTGCESIAPPHLQRVLSEQWHRRCKERLVRALFDRPAERASLLSSSQRNTALWLTALPTEARLRLHDYEIRAALRMRLHLPPRELDTLRTTACPCGGDLQRDPLHFHSCVLLKRTAVTVRHDLVLQTLSALAGELCIPHKVEPRPLYIVGEGAKQSRQKPDLLLVTANHRAAELLTDVAIVHPAAPSCVNTGLAERSLGAAKNRETRKQNKYGHLVRSEKRGVRELKAFVMESFGAFGPEADYVLKTMFKHAISDKSGDTPQLTEARMFLAIALQRGNARIDRKGTEIISSLFDELLPLPPHRPRGIAAAAFARR